MHGDFTRLTFDPADGFRAVLLQQGRVFLDAESNEQVAITAYHDEVRTRDVVSASGGPGRGAGWAVVDADGAAPAGTPWSGLFLTPGRYYVDGVLVESTPVAGAPGQRLADQPFLPRTGALPGLPEPAADGRYAVVLDVFGHHVTPDEDPSLLESALGGPDTATRLRTAWQVRLARVDDDATCLDVSGRGWGVRRSATMTASLAQPAPEDDPCRITTAGGYQLLENQLYRVQVHDVDAGGDATYVWSRENGSIVAGLVAMGPATSAAHDAVLTVDREGRDEELSITDGALVEVTSVDRQLHGLPGFLATVVGSSELSLPVRWSGPAPADVASLGSTPLVRRWEGGPAPADGVPAPLEGGIRVRFDPDAGPFSVGDHWLVPARTARLVYGVSALAGTIEWPADDSGQPLPQPPAGVAHHVTAIALLDRAAGAGEAGGWTLVADCRRLFPSLTDLVSIDLLGGDAQVAPPGDPLPEPVRVVVRNGGLPVSGARVCFTSRGGHLSAASAVPDADAPDELPVTTDDSGYAEVRWLLPPRDGPDTQVLTAVLLDPADAPTGAEVRVTGRRQPRTSGAACLVVPAGSDLVQLFAQLSGADSLVLCLQAGDWETKQPAVLSRVGTVRVEGADAATRLTSTAESALRFEDCRDVHVRDLSVQSRPVRGAEDVAGALAVLRADRVHVERVAARITGAPVDSSSAIRVGGHRGADSDPRDRVYADRVVVRDCRVEVGDLQTGVLVADALRCDVVGTEVSAWRPADSGPPVLQEWLREAAFARLVALRAIAAAPGDGRDLGPRTGFAERVDGVLDQSFGTEIVGLQGQPDRAGWRDYAAVVGSRDLAEVQERVRGDLMSADPESRFYREGTLFARWRQRVELDLAAGPAAGRGIAVTGFAGTDVRVLDCSVTGALQGIVTDVSDRDLLPETVPRVQLRGNTIVPPPRSAVAFAEQAMFVGTCQVLTVSANEVRAVGEQQFPVDGLSCARRLGVHAVADRNTFDGIAVGIRVGPAGAPPTTLRVARDNVSTAGPVLVDGSGIWRSEGNVP